MYFVILHNNCKASTNFELERLLKSKIISRLEYHFSMEIEM